MVEDAEACVDIGRRDSDMRHCPDAVRAEGAHADASRLERQVVVRPFEPTMPLDFLACFGRDASNLQLISGFCE